MSDWKAPNWLRALEIIFGLVAIVLGIAVLLMPNVAVETLIFLLYFALFFIGIGRILRGALFKLLPLGLRVLDIIIGIVLIGLSILVLAYQYPNFATAVLISWLAIALLINGLTSIVVGVSAKILKNWIRGLLVVVGVLTIISSIIVLVYPDVAILTLTLLLSLGLIWGGIDAIITGVKGTP